MFYSGWAFLAPTSMNVSALSTEMCHAHRAPHDGAAFVSQELLADVTKAAPAQAHQPQRSEDTSLTPDAAAAAHFNADYSQLKENNTEADRLKEAAPSGGKAHHSRRSHTSARHHSVNGCVLHLAPRPALSYKEMERQLRHRAAGASDCFHVKSNIPIFARSGVLLMECVVGRPACANLCCAEKGEEINDAAQKAEDSKAKSVKHPLPALVVGVCKRQLPWYKLPGETSNSIGFYVAQRHVVKDGGDDRDEVVVPCGTNNNSSSTGGGGRISEGDTIGCLVDLVQHALSFTVNKQIVSTQSIDPSYEDGSLYFAVGLARRPQQATDVTVRFFTGSECLNVALRSSSSTRTSTMRYPHDQMDKPLQKLCCPPHPCFPLAQYVRTLAIAAVQQRGLGNVGEASFVRAAASAAGSPADAQDFVSAISGQHHSRNTVTATAAALSAADGSPSLFTSKALSEEAVRDMCTAAVLRDYLSSRGMVYTLKALDAELDDLAPTHARLYPKLFPGSSGERDAQTSSADEAQGRHRAAEKHHTVSTTQRSGSSSKNLNDSSEALLPCTLPQVGETRTAWQTFAESVSELRRTLLAPPSRSTSTTESSSRISDLLLTHVLWKPPLIVSFARFVDNSMNGLSVAIPFFLRNRNAESSWHASSETTAFFATAENEDSTGINKSGKDGKTHQVDQTQSSSCFLNASPYEWFRATVDPALLTLCFLSVRRDVDYLLHAHYAVQDMWRILRKYLRSAEEACEAVNHDRAQGAASAAPLCTFAPNMETERQELATFTEFFAQLMWESSHTLPSAVAHAHCTQQPGGGSLSAGIASPVPLQVKTMEALAGLAGHTDEVLCCNSLLRDNVPDGKKGFDELCNEVREFRALASTHNGFPTKPAAAAAKKNTANFSKALLSDQTRQTAFSRPFAHAVLFLYNRAVVPASAPSRSAQVRLLQTLCSLLTQTFSSLRQVMRFEQEPNEQSCAQDQESQSTRLHVALTFIDLLEALLDSVQERFQQLVWRRLAHALEEANKQLEERLCLWQWFAEEIIREAAAPQERSNDCASARDHHEPISEWVSDYGLEEVGEEDTPSSKVRSDEDREGEEHNFIAHEATRISGGTVHSETESLSPTASFSFFRAAATSEEGEDDSNNCDYVQCGEGSEGKGKVAPTGTKSGLSSSKVLFYESLTEALPCLRLLWRRVAARAALEPSQHLVTDLFVQELRASLAFAPDVGWREKGSVTDAQADNIKGVSSVPSTSTTVNIALNGESTGVKRRLSVDAEGDAVEGLKAENRTGKTSTVSDVALASKTQWFTEELYLSSVYMKRVLKHLSGR